MRPAKSKLRKFKLDPKYPHHRSDGITRRNRKAQEYRQGRK